MELSEINIYPIKSCGGISVNSAKIEARGLELDRRWMLVDENNRFLTQREFPQMAKLHLAIEKNFLIVSAEEIEDLQIPLTIDSDERIKVQIWQDICDAIAHQSIVNKWFSATLETSCRLVFMPDDAERSVEAEFALRNEDIVNFADSHPYLLIGEGSLENLNGRLAKPVGMNRFRPNLTFSGGAAFAEDSWNRIRIGETYFYVAKSCARCVLTTIDQTQGAFDGKDPLKTLAAFRTVKTDGKNKVLFGRYLIAENVGKTISVTDKIEVLN